MGVFTFGTFLNIVMLLNGSDKAWIQRSAILDIIIDVLNKKIGEIQNIAIKEKKNFYCVQSESLITEKNLQML